MIVPTFGAHGGMREIPEMTDTVSALPFLPIDREDPMAPHPELADWRLKNPVYRVRFPNGVPTWLVTDWNLFRSVMADPRFSSQKSGVEPQLRKTSLFFPEVPGLFINMDGAEHAAYRRIVLSEFASSKLAAMRPWLEGLVDTHLDALAARPQPVDLLPELAFPVPAMVVCRLLGLPYDDRQIFEDAAAVLLSNTASTEEVHAKIASLFDYFLPFIARKRSQPGDDMISRLALGENERQMSDLEIAIIATILVVAGFDSTTQMIAMSVITLLQHPEALREFKAMGGDVKDAIEELLRFNTGIGGSPMIRRAVEDVKVGDVLVKAGDWIACSISAANRDTQLCSDPDKLDLRRKRVPHVAFGFGSHNCPGQNLSRLELSVVLPKLFARFPRLQLAKPYRDLPFRHEAMAVYGVFELPVTW